MIGVMGRTSKQNNSHMMSTMNVCGLFFQIIRLIKVSRVQLIFSIISATNMKHRSLSKKDQSTTQTCSLFKSKTSATIPEQPS